MKIAFIISDYNFHGGAQKTATLAKHLELLGHNVTIIVINDVYILFRFDDCIFGLLSKEVICKFCSLL